VWLNCATSHALLCLADGLWCAAVRLHWLLVTAVILASEEDCRKVDLGFVSTECRSDRTREPFLQDLAWNGVITVYPMLLAYCKIRMQCFPCVQAPHTVDVQLQEYCGFIDSCAGCHRYALNRSGTTLSAGASPPDRSLLQNQSFQ
jgi:hypothetical protein